MLSYIKRVLSNFFKYDSEIEQFILSKNPQSIAEIDHWISIHNRKSLGRVL